MGKQIFSKRAFINKEGYHSNANVSSNITRNDFGHNGFYATYKLSDCRRTVELSIDLDDLEEYENTIYKLDQILSTTESFRKEILKLKPEIEEIVKKRKLEEEKEKKESKDS